MREIEFRGKRIDNGEWTFGYYYCHKGLDEHYILPIDETPFYNGIPIVPRSFSNCAINKETLGQYTGLKDKNGTKIFEGDKVKILKDSVCSSSEIGEIGTVCFENGSFMIDFFDKYDDIVENDFLSNFKNEYCEVVGNKYDDF